MDKKNKVMIIGGHFTAAIAVLEELAKNTTLSFVWVGHTYTMLGDKEPSAEYKEITLRNIPFYNLKTGKLYRHLSYKGVLSLLRIPGGFLQAWSILKKEQPNIIVSFGGYLAVPVVIAGWMQHIPIVTHEQTVNSGLSNRIIAHFAKKIMVAWQSSVPLFPKNKVVYTGNPLRKEIFTADRPLVDFGNSLPSILIINGNQGSHQINIFLKDIIPDLVNRYNVIHQTGGNSIYKDYDSLEPLAKQFPNYKLFKGIWGDDIGRALAQSQFVISRSGANTVYELAALHKPSIMIPLTYATHNEQYANAKFLADHGLAVILNDETMTKESFIAAINQVAEIHPQATEPLVNLQAAQSIAHCIESVLG
jgi:UDP-N-acetylglucosamine--N-acetylmuramyl-(pentapeptide) pyrophosphoryl-undecaprenol N-acetylglucosamine transferase